MGIRLNGSGIGGDIGSHLINHLIEHVLTYNSSKSYSLCFKPKHIKVDRPYFYLNRLEILRVHQCKYLGVMISTKICDIVLKLEANENMLYKH